VERAQLLVLNSGDIIERGSLTPKEGKESMRADRDNFSIITRSKRKKRQKLHGVLS
jgi:hypothetical protein